MNQRESPDLGRPQDLPTADSLFGPSPSPIANRPFSPATTVSSSSTSTSTTTTATTITTTNANTNTTTLTAAAATIHSHGSVQQPLLNQSPFAATARPPFRPVRPPLHQQQRPPLPALARPPPQVRPQQIRPQLHPHPQQVRPQPPAPQPARPPQARPQPHPPQNLPQRPPLPSPPPRPRSFQQQGARPEQRAASPNQNRQDVFGGAQVTDQPPSSKANGQGLPNPATTHPTGSSSSLQQNTDKDILPSADVLFGASSPFDLFQPAPPMAKPIVPQQQRPIQPMASPPRDVEHQQQEGALDASSLFVSPLQESSKPTSGSASQVNKDTHGFASNQHHSSHTMVVEQKQQETSRNETIFQGTTSQEDIPFSSSKSHHQDVFHSSSKITVQQKQEISNSAGFDPDPSLLFAGSADMDTARLFSGVPSGAPSSFFAGLALQRPKDTLAQHITTTTISSSKTSDLTNNLGTISKQPTTSDYPALTSFSEKQDSKQPTTSDYPALTSFSEKQDKDAFGNSANTQSTPVFSSTKLDTVVSPVISWTPSQEIPPSSSQTISSIFTLEHQHVLPPKNALPQHVTSGKSMDGDGTMSDEPRPTPSLSHDPVSLDDSIQTSEIAKTDTTTDHLTTTTSFSGNSTLIGQLQADALSPPHGYTPHPVTPPQAQSMPHVHHETSPPHQPVESLSLVKQADDTVDQLLSLNISRPPPTTPSDLPIPFDESLSGPCSPVFNREFLAAVSPSGASGNGLAVQPGSYSIMELGSELAQSPYFPHNRQSPFIQEPEGQQAISGQSFNSPRWIMQQFETEASNFDQVSLNEDSITTAPKSSSPPPKERGLASLLDPSTLSAVEDLLNMPKSAAFERGMSRLFKGVKSSASSIFASPLGHVQSKPPSDADQGEKTLETLASPKIEPLNDPVSFLPTQPLDESEKPLDESEKALDQPSPPLPGDIKALDPEGSNTIEEQPTLEASSDIQDLSQAIPSLPPQQQPVYDPGYSQSSQHAKVLGQPLQEAEPSSHDTSLAPVEEKGDVVFSGHNADDNHGNVSSLFQVPTTIDASDHGEDWLRGPAPSSSLADPSPDSLPEKDIHVPSSASQGSSEQTMAHNAEMSTSTSRLPMTENTKLEHLNPINFEHRRPSSPSVLDRETILRKQAAVSALLAEQAGKSGIRASAETKTKLLEKARELLEKRQAKSASQSPTLNTYTGFTRQTSPVMDFGGSPRLSMESNGPSFDLSGGKIAAQSTASVLTPNLSERSEYQPSISPALAETGYTLAIHRHEDPTSALSGNQQLKEQVDSLLAKNKVLEESQIQMAALESQNQELHSELDNIRAELQIAHAAVKESYTKYSQQADDLTKEIQRHQADAAHAWRLVREQDTSSDLTTKCQRLEEELEQAQHTIRSYQASNAELGRLSAENEQLRQELWHTQQQLKEISMEQTRQTTPSNNDTASVEQLTREAEGLRRQLKGQHMEMKDLEDMLKRSEAEKRELALKIANLEHSLEDAAKHRTELMNHQAMKDEAYRVIQEKLVASFEEEKAQYLDDEAFKQAKLEVRNSQLQDQVQQLQTELAEARPPANESLKDRVMQLEALLAAAQEHEANHRLRTSELESEMEGARRNEEYLQSSLSAFQEHIAQLQQELSESKKSHAKALSAREASIEEDQKTQLDSLRQELNQALLREDTLKNELNLALQTTQEAVLQSERENSEGPSFQQIEYDRALERALKWQEDCLAAQEEKMLVEDQLQRVNMELMAARIEIGQLEANVGSDSGPNDSAAIHREIEQELEDTKAQLEQLKRDELPLVQELEYLRSERVRLASELDTALRRTEDMDDLRNKEIQVEQLEALLNEERKASNEHTKGLEKQLRKTEQLLLDRQKEVEQLTLDLDNITFKSTAAEREIALLREQQSEALMDRNHSTIGLAAEEQSNPAAKLEREIETLEERVQTLEQELASARDQMRSKDQASGTLAGQLSNMQAQVGVLTDKNSQGQEQMRLVVGLFEKLLRLSDDATEADALENTLNSVLVGMEPFGVPAQPFRRVGTRFIELHQLVAEAHNKVHDLETELHRTNQLDEALKPPAATTDASQAPQTSPIETSGHDSEVEELQRKLSKAEQGIIKLQQFLQEFQNEKKMAILALEQRLEDSEKEATMTRSQLAKAQAMLLSRSSNPGTPTLGVFQIEPQSPMFQENSPHPMNASTDGIGADKVLKGTEQIRHEAVLALEPLRQQKAELERMLVDLRHRYDLSQKENDKLLSELEKENQSLKAKTDKRSPDMSSEHLERIRELELEHAELTRQLKTAQREREFTRQDMKALRAELAKLKARG